MLYWLTGILSETFTDFSVFQYLTLRGIFGVLTALLIALIVGPWMIRKLSHKQIGQSVRDDGPQSHLSKAGYANNGRRSYHSSCSGKYLTLVRLGAISTFGLCSLLF